MLRVLGWLIFGSPVSDDGRGLKQIARAGQDAGFFGSPVSDDGRGLKPLFDIGMAERNWVRPSAMTGVD